MIDHEGWKEQPSYIRSLPFQQKGKSDGGMLCPERDGAL
jgi:hypothetical protein